MDAERDGERILRPAAAVPSRDLPASVIEQWIAGDEAGMAEFTASEGGRRHLMDRALVFEEARDRPVLISALAAGLSFC